MAKAISKQAKKSPKLPFFKGRLYEFVLCLMAVAGILVLALQVPFTADSYDDRVSVLLFSVLGIVGAVSIIMIRRGFLLAIRRPKSDPQYGNPFYRWFFFWLLIPAIFIVLLPWILAGAFNGDDMNTAGVIAMLLLLPWLMILLGVLAAAIVVYPIEITIRGLISLVRTRGKDGVGRLVIGGYLLIVLAFIACGSMAASAILPGQAGHGALVAALFGLPGGYTIKDETFLWVTRVLGIFMIILPFIFHSVSKKHASSGVVKEINSKIR